jgi:segregation and condensation protein A
MESEPTYRLTGVIRTKEEMEDFEGPLTLILMLLSKNKIEIRDIRISEILEQYLAYLDEMKAMDLEIASEFVQMASYLLYLKTKMLLARGEEEVGELELLVATLEEMKARNACNAIRAVTPALLRASEGGARLHTRAPGPLPGQQTYRYRHPCWELMQAICAVSQRARTAADEESGETVEERRTRLLPRRIVYAVRDKSREILRRLGSRGALTLRELYTMSRSRSEVVATFLSVLELCSLGQTRLRRDGGEIVVRFTGGDLDAAIARVGEGTGS